MKRLFNFKRSKLAMGVVGVLAGVLLGTGALLLTGQVSADNVTFNSKRDCDSNAVVYCGAMTVAELKSKYKNDSMTRAIYAYNKAPAAFNISSADVNAMGGANTKAGRVTRSGDVIVNGKVIATNAWTAGRESMPGSTTAKTADGRTFYVRQPSVSFLSEYLDAYVVLKADGSFDFAILAACGNPVTATPKKQPKPNYELKKEVKIKGTNTWSSSVNINYGQTVVYRITVTSTGDVPVENVFVSDKMSAGLTYVPNTLKIDAHPKDPAKFFGSGIEINQIKNNDPVIATYEAVTTQKTQPNPCKEATIPNTARIDDRGSLAPITKKANVKVVCKPVTPPAQNPNYELVKQVQVKGTNTWSENVTVKAGTHVNYRLVIKSTGEAAVTNLVVKDVLPAHVTLVKGSVKRDNVAVNGGDSLITTGIKIASLAPDTQTIVTFEAVIGETVDSTGKCVTTPLRNVAAIDADKLNPKTDDALVSPQCQPPVIPEYSCKALLPTQLSRTMYNFRGQANVKNAAVKNYKLEIRDSQNNLEGTINKATSSVDTDLGNYTFKKSNETYSVRMFVTVRVGNEDKTVTSETCAKSIKIAMQPVAECTLLNAKIGVKKNDGSRDVDFTVSVNLGGGAKVNNYAYYFTADATKPDLVTDKNTATHNYKPGSYEAKVVVTFDGVADADKTSTCNVKFDIPKNPCVYNPNLDEDDEDCVKPDCVDDSSTPENECKPETPVVLGKNLPDTGAGSIIGLFAGVSAAAGAAYYAAGLRRSRES